jgi:hypothetical protein
MSAAEKKQREREKAARKKAAGGPREENDAEEEVDEEEADEDDEDEFDGPDPRIAQVCLWPPLPLAGPLRGCARRVKAPYRCVAQRAFCMAQVDRSLRCRWADEGLHCIPHARGKRS